MKSGAEASNHHVHYVGQCLVVDSSSSSSSTSVNKPHAQPHAHGVGGAPPALHSGMCTDWAGMYVWRTQNRADGARPHLHCLNIALAITISR